MGDSFAGAVPEKINFAEEEQRVLQEWNEKKIFEKSVELSKGRKRYTFFDGPPFATGLPHYGHILAGTIKDIVTRWAHQSGYYVERRFGWDTHGMPVEFEIDKMLGIKGPADIHAMGIGNYNAECRKIVMRYSAEWETSVNRLGRWIDFKNDYKTLYPWFMESVWWAFSELYKKGLVYRGVKVMPYSTACSTPISNFEAGQNYKMVKDPAVCVGFKVENTEKRYLVAWTTTPWTLPSNLAIVVHPDLEYVVAKDKATGNEYIVMEARLGELKLPDLEIVEKFLGKKLEGTLYEPLFPYFKHMRQQTNAFRVLTNTFVTTDQGTGVVHEAPYFGEIDFHCCLENGIITKDMKIVCPVDETGKFTSDVTEWAGMYVKDADKLIIKHLKDNGHLVHRGEVEHSYPFCWRSETPLLYKAVPSWFVRVEDIVPKLLENNEKTYWVPNFVKEKRFANWLRDARDWAVSRNRFWGTPINLWVSDDGEEVVPIGSIAELEQLSGKKITDLHRESVDDITIPSRTGRGVLKRTSEVFDCWFESGSMPYAQNHYPFENKDRFEENFPADFIAEGIDQTRGWFYTLLVLSTALFDRPPFKNLICNGLVLAEDGNKMSKSKKNFPDPMLVVNKYGADALRLYLINSPVVRGENLRFRETGVNELLKDVFLPWFNAYRFLGQNIKAFEESGSKFALKELPKDANVMDRWIESFTNSLGELGVDQQVVSLSVLTRVLSIICRLMAPFTPFFTEYVWKQILPLTGASEESVHFTLLPQPDESVIDESVETSVQAMRSVMDLVRVVRDKKGIAVKYPLKEMVVINRDKTFLSAVHELEQYILSELNVRKLVVSSDKDQYGVQLKAEPNFRLLGARLKGDQKKVGEYLKKEISQAELEKFLNEGKLVVLGHELTSEEVTVKYGGVGDDQASHHEYHSDANTIIVVDVSEDDSLVEEGLAREVTNRINKLRKAAKLIQSDRATIYCTISPPDCKLATVLKAHKDNVEKATNTPLVFEALPKSEKAAAVLPDNLTKIKDAGEIRLWLVGTSSAPATASDDSVTVSHKGTSFTLRLTAGEQRLTKYSDLVYEVRSALNLWSGALKLTLPDGSAVHATSDVQSLRGQSLSVTL
ncbi:unnamed protein product, partial [Mesorhabditis spiculigera]